MAAIETQGLTKKFGDVTAVHDLDLEVEEGDVFGFLGPNGAGKSTTINVLLNFVRPTEGQVEVLGYDVRKGSVASRRRTGVLPEDFGLYPRLTAAKHIEFVKRSKNADDEPGAILERVGLGDAIDRKVGGFSKGMRKRLALGMALVGEPELLVLDEPTSGLDPNGAKEVREIVREENRRGATVFFSSHILEQVEAVCNRVGILNDGKLVAQDTIDSLRDNVGSLSKIEIHVDAVTDGVLDSVRTLEGVTNVVADGSVVTVSCTDARAKIRALDAVRESAEVNDFVTHETSLEDLFHTYTGDV